MSTLVITSHTIRLLLSVHLWLNVIPFLYPNHLKNIFYHPIPVFISVRGKAKQNRNMNKPSEPPETIQIYTNAFGIVK